MHVFQVTIIEEQQNSDVFYARRVLSSSKRPVTYYHRGLCSTNPVALKESDDTSSIVALRLDC